MESIESGKRVLDLVSDRIIRITSGRLVFAALAGYAFLLVLINGRPFGVAALKEVSDGTGILDLEILYTPDQAYALFSAMGEAGRASCMSVRPAVPYSDANLASMPLKEALQSRLLARLREQEVLVESESSCALLANRAWVERLIGHE